jgi:hypothetical protein
MVLRALPLMIHRGLLCAAGWMGALAAGCGLGPAVYVEPSVQSLHAIAKVRLVHHVTPGPQYAGAILLNDQTVSLPEIDPSAPMSLALRLVPQPTKWWIRSEFYHTVSRVETYYATESYPCGSTTSGYGTTQVSTPQYCTRQVPRTRTVTEHVTDALCAAQLMHIPAAAAAYVVQFDFEGAGKCQARCLVQTRDADGRIKTELCIGSRSGPAD